MRPAIRVDNLSKSYRLGEPGRPSYRTLRESVTDSAAGAWRGLKRFGSRLAGKSSAAGISDPREFWALKNVSFEVMPGEVVGIIGRNGAGKSTLLKIMSRITEPTYGRVQLRGRVGSLLEVGTGFHPELTGRENIYMNGSILGMSRREITRAFDAIVDFSEVEQFLDTPVKRYSSGMYVRLAFAVAAHLEPEILIVDEVLAVGDARFQKKCLGKMKEASRQQRTVLFVSHNMAAVRSLCNKALLINGGILENQGRTEEITNRYLSSGLEFGSSSFNTSRHIRSSPECRIVDAWLAVDGERTQSVVWQQPFEITMIIEVASTVRLSPEYLVRDQTQYPILLAPTGHYQGFEKVLLPGQYIISSTCDGLRLAGGSYYVDLMLAETNHRFYEYYECALCLDVLESALPPHGWRFSQRAGQGAMPLALTTNIQCYYER
jgi:lipopolysaccharide transport system ATP-binding protein